MKILSIESSCDETAAAVVEDGREVISSVIASQVEEHKLYGGVVPEIASRRHAESIVGVVNEALSKARHERGTLISSGLIAGGALFGVFAAITKFAGFEYTSPLSEGVSQSLGLVAYALLICYLMWDSRRAKA